MQQTKIHLKLMLLHRMILTHWHKLGLLVVSNQEKVFKDLTCLIMLGLKTYCRLTQMTIVEMIFRKHQLLYFTNYFIFIS